LQSVDFFKTWSYVKILELNQLLFEQKYSTNDSTPYILIQFYIVIFDIGSKPEVFYILKSGRLAVETMVEIEDKNTYPIVIISNYKFKIELKVMGSVCY
jgi:hypothetical protein